MADSTYDKKIEISNKQRISFYITFNRFIDEAAKIIGPYGGAVFNSLSRHADPNGKTWPSISLIAQEWGISKMQVIRCLKKLEELNMVSIDHGDGKNNKYQICDKSEWRLPTSNCELPVAPPTSNCELLPPVTVSYPNKTHITRHIKEHLSVLLFEEITKANPHSRLLAQTPKQKEATIARWAEDIDRLIRIDKQNPSIVEEVIKKATHDGFWRYCQ